MIYTRRIILSFKIDYSFVPNIFFMNIYSETEKDLEWIKEKRDCLLTTQERLLPRYGLDTYPNLSGVDNLPSLEKFITNYNDARFTTHFTNRLVSLNNILIEERLKKITRQLEESYSQKISEQRVLIEKLLKDNRELVITLENTDTQLKILKSELDTIKKELIDED